MALTVLGVQGGPVAIQLYLALWFLSRKQTTKNPKESLENAVLDITNQITTIQSHFLVHVEMGKAALKIQDILAAIKANLTALNSRCF